jgi:hypothetical protein
MDTKLCSRCNTIKLVSEFYWQKAKNGKRYPGYCLSCASQKNKEWRVDNKERATRNDYLANLRKYGLTEDQFDKMVEESFGRCAICTEPRARLHIDHKHPTGPVRGLLCEHCNHGLGKFKDSSTLLIAAAMYLRGQEVSQSF